MNSRGPRISRPLYEALPWIYMGCGLAALIASWFHPSHIHSLVLGIPGLLAVLGGIVVALRRRDFRQMKANNYLSDLNSDATGDTDASGPDHSSED